MDAIKGLKMNLTRQIIDYNYLDKIKNDYYSDSSSTTSESDIGNDEDNEQ